MNAVEMAARVGSQHVPIDYTASVRLTKRLELFVSTRSSDRIFILDNRQNPARLFPTPSWSNEIRLAQEYISRAGEEKIKIALKKACQQITDRINEEKQKTIDKLLSLQNAQNNLASV